MPDVCHWLYLKERGMKRRIWVIRPREDTCTTIDCQLGDSGRTCLLY